MTTFRVPHRCEIDFASKATVVEPLAASAWSAGFGMLTDRFGVTWSCSVDAS